MSEIMYNLCNGEPKLFHEVQSTVSIWDCPGYKATPTGKILRCCSNHHELKQKQQWELFFGLNKRKQTYEKWIGSLYHNNPPAYSRFKSQSKDPHFYCLGCTRCCKYKDFVVQHLRSNPCNKTDAIKAVKTHMLIYICFIFILYLFYIVVIFKSVRYWIDFVKKEERQAVDQLRYEKKNQQKKIKQKKQSSCNPNYMSINYYDDDKDDDDDDNYFIDPRYNNTSSKQSIHNNNVNTSSTNNKNNNKNNNRQSSSYGERRRSTNININEAKENKDPPQFITGNINDKNLNLNIFPFNQQLIMCLYFNIYFLIVFVE